MSASNQYSIIALDKFIQATRDAGYKGITSALAELIDNALEAGARRVDVDITRSSDGEITVAVSDNGSGMTPSVLRLALQFGGSTRFNSRSGTGRYGMGLPNSSLSQARRVDVFTWRTKKTIWWSYLDVSEIASGAMTIVPAPKRWSRAALMNSRRSNSGTLVIWSKCDRIEYKSERRFFAAIRRTIGRLFRKHLWAGKRIYLCGEPVRPYDPLFIREGENIVGALAFGPTLRYELSVQDNGTKKKRSIVEVDFVELPIEKWHSFSNKDKRSLGISKKAGVSIVRAGREIDYGWFFMGKKRKENYDDWWRCEVSFDPVLDELFGVTNTKQGIRPTESLISILSPDIERVAHELNGRVRRRYLAVKEGLDRTPGELKASSKDHLLEPPAQNDKDKLSLSKYEKVPVHTNGKKSPIPGLSYRIEHRRMDENSFFIPRLGSRELVVQLNEDHPFYEFVYAPYVRSSEPVAKTLYKYLELVILAAARAECRVSPTDSQSLVKTMREEWSKNLAAFLE